MCNTEDTARVLALNPECSHMHRGPPASDRACPPGTYQPTTGQCSCMPCDGVVNPASTTCSAPSDHPHTGFSSLYPGSVTLTPHLHLASDTITYHAPTETHTDMQETVLSQDTGSGCS